MSQIIYDIIYKLPLLYIFLAIIFLGILWTYFRRISQKSQRRNTLWKCSNTLIFICIIVIIVRITLFTRSGGTSEVILMPFHSFIEARIQPEMYRSMLMNVFLFFPIGLSLPNILPDKWKHPALITIVFALVFSVGVEYLQYQYQLGRVEVDDVLCNTFGCILGTLPFQIEKRI